MSGNPFDITIHNVREKALSTDLNYLATQLQRTLLASIAEANSINLIPGSPLGGPRSGFIGSGFRLYPGAGMSPVLYPGLGFVYDTTSATSSVDGITGLDDLSSYKPLVLTDLESISVDAAPAPGTERYDIIELRVDRRRADPETRRILDPTTGSGIATPGVLKTLSWTLDGRQGRVVSPASSTAAIGYKVGVAAAIGAATEPATTAGYIKIAAIRVVGGGTVVITQSNIIDYRKLLFSNGTAHGVMGYRLPSDAAPHATGPLSLFAQVLPPGMRVGAYISNAAPVVGTTNPLNVYVLHDGTYPSPNVTANMNANPAYIVGDGTPTSELINSTDALRLAGLDAAYEAAPALDVCVGQPYYKFTFHVADVSGVLAVDPIINVGMTFIQT